MRSATRPVAVDVAAKDPQVDERVGVLSVHHDEEARRATRADRGMARSGFDVVGEAAPRRRRSSWGRISARASRWSQWACPGSTAARRAGAVAALPATTFVLLSRVRRALQEDRGRVRGGRGAARTGADTRSSAQRPGNEHGTGRPGGAATTTVQAIMSSSPRRRSSKTGSGQNRRRGAQLRRLISPPEPQQPGAAPAPRRRRPADANLEQPVPRRLAVADQKTTK